MDAMKQQLDLIVPDRDATPLLGRAREEMMHVRGRHPTFTSKSRGKVTTKAEPNTRHKLRAREGELR